MTSSAWQPSQKATSTCVAPTVACPPVSKLLLMSHVYHNPYHTPSSNHAFTEFTFIPPHWSQTLHFLRPFTATLMVYVYIYKCIKEWSPCVFCAVVAILSLFPSNPVFSLSISSLWPYSLYSILPFSPFLSALEAVSREPSVPLLVQVHCMQSLAFCPWVCMHQLTWPVNNFWGFSECRNICNQL